VLHDLPHLNLKKLKANRELIQVRDKFEITHTINNQKYDPVHA
jgi:hypothetical protein